MNGGQDMIGRLSKALLRALAMALLVAAPALILPSTSADTAQVVVLLALVAAVFTLFEYHATCPSFVEFRDAPPYNRIRFAALFLTVVALSLILRGESAPTTITRLFAFLGERVSGVLDFPYSPVRLMVLMLPDSAGPGVVDRVRIAAGLSYLVSILSLAVFAVLMWLSGWPTRRAGFNVWVNLPTFDPTAGGDVVQRLGRDAQVNLVLGFLLPFIIPATVKTVGEVVDPISLADPHTLIWTMTAWAFLPASLLMRGFALSRVAQLIVAQRKRAHGPGAERLRHA